MAKSEQPTRSAAMERLTVTISLSRPLFDAYAKELAAEIAADIPEYAGSEGFERTRRELIDDWIEEIQEGGFPAMGFDRFDAKVEVSRG